MNGRCFILFLILSSTTDIYRVNGVDNYDNTSIGIEKHRFSFKAWYIYATIACEVDESLVLSLENVHV